MCMTNFPMFAVWAELPSSPWRLRTRCLLGLAGLCLQSGSFQDTLALCATARQLLQSLHDSGVPVEHVSTLSYRMMTCCELYGQALVCAGRVSDALPILHAALSIDSSNSVGTLIIFW